MQLLQKGSNAKAQPKQRKGAGLLSRLLFLGDHSATPARGQPAGAVGLATSVAEASNDAAGATSTAEAREQPAGPSDRAGDVTYQVDLGLPRDAQRYTVVRELGRGGNGVVNLVRDAEGNEYAQKILPKVLGSQFSDTKRSTHLESLKREMDVLKQLKGCLNIVDLHEAYEDEHSVYLVMEHCSGGELWHRVGDRHYSERTVASFMRAVLRTLAIMHSHHILHRDIKPGNFMLLNEDERAPLKAIDFGLAVPYEPDQLPRSDLGLEGTPWYMAPEVLSSRVVPASDVFSAGVMAYQLLTGRFPFDDFRNPNSPSISAIWKSVLCDPLYLNKPWCAGISDEAKDFLTLLLDKDPEKRPTAKEALKHPWLHGTSAERSQGRKLARSVVQRLQRFGQRSKWKRSVLQLMAAELLKMPALAAASAGSQSMSSLSSLDGDGSTHGEGSIPREVAALQRLFQQMELEGPTAVVDPTKLHDALQKIGYRLELSEVERLLNSVDVSGEGRMDRAAFLGALIDWRQIQQSYSKLWLSLAQRTFENMDKDKDGVLRVDEVLSALRHKLPEAELHAAVEQAMREASEGASKAAGLLASDDEGYVYSEGEESGQDRLSPGMGRAVAEQQQQQQHAAHAVGVCQEAAGEVAADGHAASGAMAVGSMWPAGMPHNNGRLRGIDFPDFLRMLKAGSMDSLDMYDDRYGNPSPGLHGSTLAGGPGSVDRLNGLLQKSPSVASTSSLAQAAADGSSRHGSYFYNGGRYQQGSTGGWDMGSVHGGASLHGSNNGSRTAFRFDTGGSMHGTAGAGAIAAAAGAAAPAAAAAASDSAAVTAPVPSTFFRFDVAKDYVAAPPEKPADPNKVVFRFDVTPPPPPATAAQPTVSNSSAASGSLQSHALHTDLQAAVGTRGGYFDRRHHGSMLYASAVTGLPSVMAAGGAHSMRGVDRSVHAVHTVLETVAE